MGAVSECGSSESIDVGRTARSTSGAFAFGVENTPARAEFRPLPDPTPRVVPPSEVMRARTAADSFPASTSDVRLGVATTEKVVEPVRMSSAARERVIDVVKDAADVGISGQEVRDALSGPVAETASAARAWDAVADHPDDRSLAALRQELTTCAVVDERAVSTRLESLQRRIEQERATLGAVDVAEDPQTGLRRTWWHPEPVKNPREQAGDSAGEDRGHILLVELSGAQVGDENRQLNVYVRTIEDPKVDFESLMTDSDVAAALARLAATPGDADLRQAAVDALAGVQRSAADWTEAYAGTGTAAMSPGASNLDGTVAVVRSRGVQVGDGQYQENTIVHTVSPEVAATVLLENPDVVNGLLDVASAPGDATAAAAFERAVGAALVADLACSAAARRGHGTVYRPPGSGRTLRVQNAAGVSVGNRVSQKTEFAQTAYIGRKVRRSTNRVATGTRRAARKLGPQSSPGRKATAGSHQRS